MLREDFIKKSIEKHGDKYIYDNIHYKKLTDKISIVCKTHGPFLQNAGEHLRGSGCKKCGLHNKRVCRRLTKSEFIEKANSIHNNVYDYSKVNYYNNRSEVEIICKNNHTFFQRPQHHFRGIGCQQCKESLKNSPK